jgi:hypothetical protein
MLRVLRQMPFMKVLAIAQTVLLVRRHFRHLTPEDRRRLRELVRRGRSMTATEREELRLLLAKMEPKAFALAAANALSPVRLPRWLLGRLTR